MIFCFNVFECILLTSVSLPHTHCRDIGSIHDGIGDELSFFIQWSAVFLGGFIVAFIREWRLTLLLLGIVPVVAISGIAAAKVSSI